VVAQVRHLVSLLAQPVDDSLIDAHVGEKPHAGSAELHLLLREPSRVAEGLLDVLALEIGVARENLVEGGAVRDLTDDDRDRNPHPANAGAAAHDVGIKCDAVEHRPLLSSYQRSACGRKASTRFLRPSRRPARYPRANASRHRIRGSSKQTRSAENASGSNDPPAQRSMSSCSSCSGSARLMGAA